MGKFINIYQSLKIDNPNTLYLFESGAFFIAINEDAFFLSDLLNFKLTDFGKENVKCGFPKSKIDYYSKILNIQNINFNIIYNNSTSNFASPNLTNPFLGVISEIEHLNLDNITFKEAYIFLEKQYNYIKRIRKSKKDNAL